MLNLQFYWLSTSKKKKAKFGKKNPVAWPTFHWVNYLNTAIDNNIPELFIQNMVLLLLVLRNFTS